MPFIEDAVEPLNGFHPGDVGPEILVVDDDPREVPSSQRSIYDASHERLLDVWMDPF